MTSAPLPTPPWRRTVRREESPRRPVSQDLIISAALDVVRSEGLDALSIRRIAQKLRIGPATIYVHFANKDELLELALDTVFTDVKVPAPDPDRWSEQVCEIAREMHRELIGYGDLARASLGRVSFGPNALRVAEGLIAVMAAAGLPVEAAAWARERLFLYVCADAYETSQFEAKERTYGSAGVQAFLGQVREYYATLPAEEFPYSAGHPDAMVNTSCEQRFELGLQLLVRGLESWSRDPALPAAGDA